MADDEWWYISKEGEKTGPAPVDLLEGLWLAGELDGLSLVWREGLKDYIPVAESELRARFQSLDDDEEEVDNEGDETKPKDEGSDLMQHADANTKPQTWTALDLWEKQWASTKTDSGTEYYANLYTQESSWEPPTKPEVVLNPREI